MPIWAQWIGEAFLMTHTLRGRPRHHLKGNTGAEILPNLWPIAVFTLIVAAIAISYYREKAD
jgi:ABC-2 type transport system permease protein